eukprot:m51a1_g6135 hypothetical protein (120) ;mRNA; r:241943-242415
MRTQIIALAAAVAMLAHAAAACSGTCADIYSATCSNGFQTGTRPAGPLTGRSHAAGLIAGLCPGADNIQCCTGKLCFGTCANTDQYACSNGFTSNLCAGPNNIMCCTGYLIPLWNAHRN